MNTLLEKLVLQGKAESKVLSCFGAQFYSLLIPSNQTIVITQIDWTPFINFPLTSGRFPALSELNKWSQYQLKISDDKNRHFLHFDNSINFSSVDQTGYTAQTDLEKWLLFGGLFQPGNMVTIPCYFPLQQELRIALTRKDLSRISYIQNTLSPISKEPVTPEGVKNINQVNLLYDGGNQTLNYLPGTQLNSNTPYFFAGNNSDGYYFGTDSNIAEETLTPITDYPYPALAFTQPQFIIHYTIIKENLIGLID